MRYINQIASPVLGFSSKTGAPLNTEDNKAKTAAAKNFNIVECKFTDKQQRQCYPFEDKKKEWREKKNTENKGIIFFKIN
jgi:hypothetical protein